MTLLTRILVPFEKKKKKDIESCHFLLKFLKRNLKKFKDNQISVILLYF